MSGFDETIGAAVVGTARQDPANLPSPAGLQLAEAGAEQRLLDLAAAHDLMRRAGYRPAAIASAWPLAPADQRPPCNRAASTLLLQLLDDSRPLLRYWMMGAARAGQRLQAVVLPELLGRVHKDSHLCREAAPLLDARGVWLCTLNPAWKGVLGSAPALPDAQAWQEGTPEVREAALRAAVAADRAQARDWLQQLWASDPARLRERWLACFAPVRAQDESWLEEKLDDRAEAVRQAVQRLLLGLPGSGLRRRALRRALDCLRSKRRLLGGSQLEVTPPSAFHPEWARDGIVAKPPQGTGERAHWLRQILAQAAPTELAAALQLDVPGLFKLARACGDWAEAVEAACNEAAVNCRDQAALRLVLPQLLKGAAAEPLRACLAAVDTATADATLAEALPSLGADGAGFGMLKLVLEERAAVPYPPALAVALSGFLELALSAQENSAYWLRQIPAAALVWLSDADATALKSRWLAMLPRRDPLQDPAPRDVALQELIDFLERRQAIAAAFAAPFAAPFADGDTA